MASFVGGDRHSMATSTPVLERRDLTIATRVDPTREWGRPLQMSAEVTAKVDQLWQTLGL